MLEIAGGADVLADMQRQSVMMSTEMILTRAPDVIIELLYGAANPSGNLDAERGVWNAVPSVPAVKNGLVYLLVGDEFVVPGPRIVTAADRFARALHPEASNEQGSSPGRSLAASGSRISSSHRLHLMSDLYPQRIVCLTEETTETLYLLGQGHRVAGVSGYTVRPPSATETESFGVHQRAVRQVEALEPDLLSRSRITGGSWGRARASRHRRGDVQSAQRRRDLQMIRMLSGLVGCQLRPRCLRTLGVRPRSHSESAARFPR